MKQIILSLFSFLFAITIHAQTERVYKQVLRGGYGLAYNYVLSSQKTNTSPSQTLFGSNGHSFRLGFAWDPFPTEKKVAATDRLAPGLGIAFDLGFQFGKTSTKDLEAFAASITVPFQYKIAQSSTSWKQVVLMVGPVLRLGKRNNSLPPCEISAIAGAAFRLSPRTITIDQTGMPAADRRVYDETESSTGFAWHTEISIPVFRLGKRTNGFIEAGYGFQGGTVGVSFRLGKRITGL